MMMIDAFRTLGVSPDASAEEIRLAYFARVRSAGPDSQPTEFQRIREAYDALRDEAGRARARVLRLYGSDVGEAERSALVLDASRRHMRQRYLDLVLAWTLSEDGGPTVDVG